jgi:hypothetical protein
MSLAARVLLLSSRQRSTTPLAAQRDVISKPTIPRLFRERSGQWSRHVARQTLLQRCLRECQSTQARRREPEQLQVIVDINDSQRSEANDFDCYCRNKCVLVNRGSRLNPDWYAVLHSAALILCTFKFFHAYCCRISGIVQHRIEGERYVCVRLGLNRSSPRVRIHDPEALRLLTIHEARDRFESLHLSKLLYLSYLLCLSSFF